MSQLGKSHHHLLAQIDTQLRHINTQLRQLVPTKTLRPGDGKTFPRSGQTVQVKYVGRLPNGTIFDRSPRGQPFTFQLNRGQVIKGWDLVVAKMSLGQKVRATIPPNLAYGSKGAGGGKIPPNTALTFTMKLVSIQ